MIKLFKNSLPLAIIIAGIIIGGAITYTNQKSIPGTLPSQEAADKALSFINANMLQEGITASLINIEESNGLYKMKLKIGEEEVEPYVSLDGRLLFIQAVDMGETSQEEESQGTVKRDIPDVKLFVMSYCPYGLQAQKALLPAYDLLKGKADIGVYFVSYIMHDEIEIDENLRQYCIQEEQEDKFNSYLSCFVVAGNSSDCLSSAGADTSMLDSCISSADVEFKVTENYNDKDSWLSGVYPKFDVHDDLNQQYGVSGSPTLVVNDIVLVSEKKYCPQGEIKCAVIPDLVRSPEKFKEIICQAFNTPPEECSQTLSEDAASYGFGGGTGDSSGGACE